MAIEDRSYIVEQLSRVERQLQRALLAVSEAKRDFEERGQTDTITGLLNDLLWTLPNLGIQTVVSATMREAERGKSE